MTQRKPIKHRSSKRAALYREHRAPLVARLLIERPTCQRCLKAGSQDIHEIKSRARGGSILDESNLLALCRTCHNWITTHPKEALEQGFLKNSWDD